MAPDYTRGHSARSAVFKRVRSVSSCKATFGSTMPMGPAPIADNGLMTKEVVTTTRIATMHLIIRPLSTRSLKLKTLFAGCSKRSHRRGARKIDPSTSAQDRLPTRSRNRMLEVVNASLHYSTTPLFQSPVRGSESIERNEAYEFFSATCLDMRVSRS